jgi:hypothetical protein
MTASVRLASFATKNWELKDIEWDPTETLERKPPKKGDIVQLIFTGAEGYTERMWVEITRRSFPYFVGRLRNIPITIKKLAFGSQVVFLPEHVVRIEETA